MVLETRSRDPPPTRAGDWLPIDQHEFQHIDSTGDAVKFFQPLVEVIEMAPTCGRADRCLLARVSRLGDTLPYLMLVHRRLDDGSP